MKKYRFTRVELLIVVVIAAMAGALVIPAVSHAGNRSDTTVCADGLRHMSEAVKAYAADNQNVVPGVYILKDGKVVDSWIGVLTPYTDYQIHEVKRLCPSNGLDYNPDNRTDDGAWCARYALVNLPGDSMAFIALDKIAKPAEKVYMADGQVNAKNFVDKWDLCNVPGQVIQPSAPHEDGTNMLFADGHVAWGKRIASGDNINWPDVAGAAFLEGNHCRVAQK